MKPDRFGVFGAAALAVAALTLGAQQRLTTPYTAETELVRITATVSDADGKAVTDLQKNDFTITDDTVPQNIAFFAHDVDTPVSVVVVLDISGSMDDHFEAVRNGMRDFVAGARPDDEIALLTFTSTSRLVSPLNGDRAQLMTSLDALHAGGGTALYQAVVDGLDVLQRATHRKRVLLVVTDGHNTTGGVSPRGATKVFQRAEVLMYGLGVGHGGPDSVKNRFLTLFDNGRMRALRAMADSSGGRVELIASAGSRTADDVKATIGEYGRELRQQYTLGYYPPARLPENGKAKDQQMHTVRVTVSRPAHVVRARRVYFRTATR